VAPGRSRFRSARLSGSAQSYRYSRQDALLPGGTTIRDTPAAGLTVPFVVMAWAQPWSPIVEARRPVCLAADLTGGRPGPRWKAESRGHAERSTSAKMPFFAYTPAKGGALMPWTTI